MSEETIECPFCQITSQASILANGKFLLHSTAQIGNESFSPKLKLHGDDILCRVLICSNAQCKKQSFWILYKNEVGDVVEKKLIPKSSAKPVPKYVPEFIREDYEEACLVLEDSAKASATLSRRCLQGMIRDFHGIKEKTLHAEIEALKSTDVPPEIINALLGMKHIGNIGAHPDKMIDVSKEDAAFLVKMLGILFEDWYVSRKNKTALIEKVAALKQNKTTETPNSDQNGTPS